MAQEIEEIRKDLARVREELARIEYSVAHVELKLKGRPEGERLNEIKEELRKKYPNMEFTQRTLRLLRLVGTQPYNPISKDKKIIAEAMAEKYA